MTALHPGGVYLEMMRGFTMNVGGMKKMLRVGESDNIKGNQVVVYSKEGLKHSHGHHDHILEQTHE